MSVQLFRGDEWDRRNALIPPWWADPGFAAWADRLHAPAAAVEPPEDEIRYLAEPDADEDPTAAEGSHQVWLIGQALPE